MKTQAATTQRRGYRINADGTVYRRIANLRTGEWTSLPVRRGTKLEAEVLAKATRKRSA